MFKHANRATLIASVATLCVCLAPAAMAQDSDTAAETEQAGAADIVVTAQRREQKLQDVPIAITAISADRAEKIGITNSEALVAVTPGLTVTRGPGGASTFLRGVGAAIGQTRSVGVYVDDVYYGSPASNLFNFNNIAQVEISKGPQGTLFGRNATAGVIQVRTKAPGSNPGIDVSATVANYGTISGQLYADQDLSDTLAVNFAAVGSKQHDGWGRNAITGEDIFLGHNYAFRGQVGFDDGDTRIRLIGDYSRAKEDFGLNLQAAPGTRTSGGGTFQGKYLTQIPVNDTFLNVQRGLSLKVEQDFDSVSVIGITAYRYARLFTRLDQDGGPLTAVDSTLDGITHALSQELRIQSENDGPFSWILGGFYYRERFSYDPITQSGTTQAANGGSSAIYSKQLLNSFAGFADATYEIGANTRITSGIRYTHDNYRESTFTVIANGTTPPASVKQQDDVSTKITYRAVLDHHFTPDIMGYASLSRGFRSGGFQLTAPTAPAIDPEVLDAYEIGLKTTLFDRRMRFNIAGYYYDFTDLQVSVVQAALVSTINAGAARIKGIDVEMDIDAAEGLNLQAAFSYSDAKYTEFANGQIFVPRPGTCTPAPANTGPVTGGNLQCVGDLAGYRLPQAPEWTANAGFAYTHDTPGGEFTLSGNVYYNDGFFWAADNQVRQGNYVLANASLLWRHPSESFDVRFWANNIFNSYYSINFSHGALRDGSSPGAPRTYGVTVGVHF